MFQPTAVSIMLAQLRQVICAEPPIDDDRRHLLAERHSAPAPEGSSAAALGGGGAGVHLTGVQLTGEGCSIRGTGVNDQAVVACMDRGRVSLAPDGGPLIDTGWAALEDRARAAISKSNDPQHPRRIDTGLKRLRDPESTIGGTVTNVLGRSSTFQVAKAQVAKEPEVAKAQVAKAMPLLEGAFAVAFEQILKGAHMCANRVKEQRPIKATQAERVRKNIEHLPQAERSAPVQVAKGAEPQPRKTGLGLIEKRWA